MSFARTLYYCSIFHKEKYYVVLVEDALMIVSLFDLSLGHIGNGWNPRILIQAAHQIGRHQRL